MNNTNDSPMKYLKNSDAEYRKNGHWTTSEEIRFKESLFLYGKNWKSVHEYIKTRTVRQCKSHAQKFFGKLKKRFMNDYALKANYFKDIYSYGYTWVQDYIKKYFEPSLNQFLKNEDKIILNRREKNISEVERLREILLKSIVGLPAKVGKKAKKYQPLTCYCGYGKKVCDCEENCCQTKAESEKSKFISSDTNNQHKNTIFKITKIFNKEVNPQLNKEQLPIDFEPSTIIGPNNIFNLEYFGKDELEKNRILDKSDILTNDHFNKEEVYTLNLNSDSMNENQLNLNFNNHPNLPHFQLNIPINNSEIEKNNKSDVHFFFDKEEEKSNDNNINQGCLFPDSEDDFFV